MGGFHAQGIVQLRSPVTCMDSVVHTTCRKGARVRAPHANSRVVSGQGACCVFLLTTKFTDLNIVIVVVDLAANYSSKTSALLLGAE